MNNADKILISNFENLIKKILKLVNSYKETSSKISKLTNERIKILDINNHQEKDDIIFYTSIFDDTIFYLKKYLKIRKKKFINKNLNIKNKYDFMPIWIVLIYLIVIFFMFTLYCMFFK